jgi:hypothetical protein
MFGLSITEHLRRNAQSCIRTSSLGLRNDVASLPPQNLTQQSGPITRLVPDLCPTHQNYNCMVQFLSGLSQSQLPTKENLNDADNNTVRNRIRVAFECRMMTNKGNSILPFNLSNKYEEETEDYHVHLISLTNNETVLPSKLLKDSSWVNYVIHFLDLDKTAAAISKVSESNTKQLICC